MPVTYPPAGDPQQPYQPPSPPQYPSPQQPYQPPAQYQPAPGPYEPPAQYQGYDPTGQFQPPAQFQPPTGQFQPAGAGGQQSGSGKWVLLIAGAFLALLVVVVGGWFFVQRVLVDSPTDVTERYLDAVNDRDRAAVVDMVCSSERPKAVRGNDYVDDDDDKTTIDWKILSETKGRNSAEVRARVTLHDPESDRTQSVNISVTLVKEDGDWMICGVRTDD
ncbi:hypothetical protein GCM10009827_038260 [Dactylosporangium maewongense]|uniref:DUF4878 domain-containing protein n=1 Tax=Dactylosporangium maewongense TaxID=634393 RepID=A0ABN2AHB0_9ACTN